MLTAKQKTERNRAGVRKWYDENRKDYNAVRRERYAANGDAREKARQRAARYRKEAPTIERQLTREYHGRNVSVLSTGQVAALMDRTPQMLRNWQKEGLIPESVFPDKHRLYTKKQSRAVVRLDTLIRENNGSWAAPKVKKAIVRLHKNW